MARECLTNISANLWAMIAKHVYVDKDPQTLLPYQIYRHQYGSDRNKTWKSWREWWSFYTWMEKSKSEDLYSGHYCKYNLWISFNWCQCTRKTHGGFSPRQEGREILYRSFKGEFYIRSNHESELYGLIKRPLSMHLANRNCSSARSRLGKLNCLIVAALKSANKV